MSLKGKDIANNSYVNVDDIGEGSDAALLCHTDKTNCCNANNMGRTKAGEWYYPNGTTVGIEDTRINPYEFYRNRDKQVVRLNHRNGTFVEKGRFRCEIPDVNSISQSIYVHMGRFIM